MPRSKIESVDAGSVESPGESQELIDMLAGHGDSEEPEPDAQPEEPTEDAEGTEFEEQEEDLAERLARLQQRLGTEEDVSVVKSQRDRIRNQFEEYRSQIEPVMEQLAQRLQQLEQSRVQSDFQRWEQQWQQYVGAAPNAQERQWRESQFAQARQAALQQIALHQREQQLGQREQMLQQTGGDHAQQALVDFVIGMYEEIAKTVGVDSAKLNRENYSALKQSFAEQLQEKQKLAQKAPPKLPTRPQRGGHTSAPRDVYDWFQSYAQKGDYGSIEQAFQAMKQFEGLRLEDILSR